jgi:hypothetical protein
VYDFNSIKCTKNLLCICEILIRIRCLLSTVVPAHVVTIIKQSLVLKGHLFLVLSWKISYEIRPLSLCPNGDLLIQVWLYFSRDDPRTSKNILNNVMSGNLSINQLKLFVESFLFPHPPRRVGGIISYLRVYPWALRLYHPEALLYSLRQSRRLYSGAEGWYNLNAHG